MRLRLWLSPHESIPNPTIGYGYNHSISSLIYDLLRSEGMHEIYQRDGYHHFVFSWIHGLRPRTHILHVPPRVYVDIASPVREIYEAIRRALIDENLVRIHGLDFRVLGIQRLPVVKRNGTQCLQTTSPVLVRKYRPDIEKRWDIGPDDPEYEERLVRKTMNRYRDLHGQSSSFSICSISHCRQRRVHVKGGWYICFDYDIKINTSTDVSSFILSAGLGEKTSMGFGMVKEKHETYRQTEVSAVGQESRVQRISI